MSYDSLRQLPRLTIGISDRAEGQSLLETALMVPILLVLVLNALNLGHYFFVAVNLMGAARQAAEYSIMGGASVVQTPIPVATNVQSLLADQISGALGNQQVANLPSQICSLSLGLSGQASNCNQYQGFGALSPDVDPEGPSLVLNRVDVAYQPAPLVEGALFNVVPAPDLHFYVEMRALP